jgi:anaerobic glycerol-3-phosphate dehydrogenase
VGPFGTLIVLVIAVRAMFNFFTKMLDEQTRRYDKQVERSHEVHINILNHLNEQTAVVRELNIRIKDLNSRILDNKEKQQ